MREVLALVVRDLQTTLRGRAARAAPGLLLAGAVVAAALAAGGAQATALATGFLATGLVALGVASTAGLRLPSDRAEGRERWLATTAPPAGVRRLAPALAGIVATLGATALGLALLLLALAVVGRTPTVRRFEPLAVPGAPARVARASRGGAPLALEVPRAGTVEVDMGPRWLAPEAVALPLVVRWRSGDACGEVPLAAGETLVLSVPGPGLLLLENGSAAADLIVRAARRIDPKGSLAVTLVVLVLLLGGAAAALAPVAVLLSRFVRGPAAVGGTWVLALAGLLAPLLEGIVPPGTQPAQALALEVVGAAARLAPDTRGLAHLGGPLAGLALGSAALEALLPLLLYAAGALALVLLPAPRALEPGALS